MVRASRYTIPYNLAIKARLHHIKTLGQIFNTGTMSSSYLNIEKLHATNYQTWKTMIQMILIDKDLWDIITKESPKPTEGNATPKEISDWKKRADKVTTTIVLTISTSEYVHINNITDPIVLWDKLKDVYGTTGNTAKHSLLRQLYTIKYTEGLGTLQEYLNKIILISQQLTTLREPPTNSSLTTALFTSLPKSYNNLIIILELQTNLTPTLVINYLIEEERRRNVGTTSTQTAAFAVTNKRGKKKRSTWLTCTYCKIRGYMEKDCFKKYPHKRPKGINNSLNNVKANTALTEEIEEKAAVFSIYSVGDHTRRNIYDWYLDSEATDHFAVNKDNFTIYKILNPLRKVIIGNRDTVSSIRIRTIYFNLLIGDKIKELILKDIIYIPDIDYNLLSAEVIIDNRFEIRIKENSTIIIKEDKIITITVREGRLFQLNLDYTKS